MVDLLDMRRPKKGSIRIIKKKTLWSINNQGGNILANFCKKKKKKIYIPYFINSKIKPEFLSPKVLQAYHSLSKKKDCQRCHAIGQRNTI